MNDETNQANTQAQLAPLMAIEEQDLVLLRQAYQQLEHPSLAARLSSIVGTPIETALKLLPRKWYQQLHKTAELAIEKALDTAISSLRRPSETSTHPHFYRGLVATSGAASGLLGLPGLLLELPVTTTLMLRSIAETARKEGEDLHARQTRLACMEVFALGGRTELDDAAETGYYGVRMALAGTLSTTLDRRVILGLERESTPALVDFVQAVAVRFGIPLSERAATQLLPVLGAVGGATINTIFLSHFQGMASSHFLVRRLERKYGRELVQSNYEALAAGCDTN